ncbi:MAG: hypothetical protein L0Y56_02930 [Nitrospira sp.]|nr:hypothetical protein [Nitrospira sp.]
MASYEKTKETMMEAYPRLFMDELDVLDHLFFTNGNGYEWKDALHKKCKSKIADLLTYWALAFLAILLTVMAFR